MTASDSSSEYYVIEVEPATRPVVTVEELASILRDADVDPGEPHADWQSCRSAARAASVLGGVGRVHVIKRAVKVVCGEIYHESTTYQETWDNGVLTHVRRRPTGDTPDMDTR